MKADYPDKMMRAYPRKGKAEDTEPEKLRTKRWRTKRREPRKSK